VTASIILEILEPLVDFQLNSQFTKENTLERELFESF
jgi:hypothetical protein